MSASLEADICTYHTKNAYNFCTDQYHFLKTSHIHAELEKNNPTKEILITAKIFPDKLFNLLKVKEKFAKIKAK